jgi:hypothetical protein
MARYVIAVALLLAATRAWALSEADFIAKGKRAVAIAQAQGLVVAQRIFENPKNGFVALDGPGLHEWATDAHGVVIFDLSGQTTPGTDVSHWTNDDGVDLMDAISHAITSPQGGLLAHFKGVPHPKTNRMSEADFWCGRLSDGATICATYTPGAR